MSLEVVLGICVLVFGGGDCFDIMLAMAVVMLSL